jgi:hypothetical protein
MFRYLIITIIFFFTLTFHSAAQVSTRDDSKNLEKLFGRLRENLPDEMKLAANDSVVAIIDSYASSDSVFRHRFSNLRFLGQIASPDSLVKIITWNLILEDGANLYLCYFIKRDIKSGAGRVFRLKGTYNEAAARDDTTYTSLHWYGAIYYDIRPFDFAGSTKYVLLGIDYGNSFITRKIIDAAGFDKENGIVFGLKCFSDGKTLKERVVFEYSSKAVMSLKFENDGMIVFDHLSPESPQYKDDRQFYGPDFSFDAFRLEKGFWKYKGDIDIKNK